MSSATPRAVVLGFEGVSADAGLRIDDGDEVPTPQPAAGVDVG